MQRRSPTSRLQVVPLVRSASGEKLTEIDRVPAFLVPHVFLDFSEPINLEVTTVSLGEIGVNPLGFAGKRSPTPILIIIIVDISSCTVDDICCQIHVWGIHLSV
jgi:hypothetical protein